MHSEECLHFLPRYLARIPGLPKIVPGYRDVDFARAWWTPPLSPSSALALERRQIVGLGMEPMVSLTDHDNLEAPMALQITDARAHVPVSVEWTVPYGGSIFHLGIHNLPPGQERALAARMAAYTAEPDDVSLPDILQNLDAIPEALIVLNHPFWLEEGTTAAGHRRALDALLSSCLQWIHAFELNGTRVWKENQAAAYLAEAHGRPVISGGDRHACEPSACINLTNASTFSEFVAEIRDGCSTLTFLPHYQEPMPLRILEASWDILRSYPEYPGRVDWTDRIFYKCDDGVVRTAGSLWNHQAPAPLGALRGLVRLLAMSGLRPTLRSLLAGNGEILS